MWYPAQNNTTGIIGMLDTVRDGIAYQHGAGLGGSIIGITILLPLFMIIFLVLGKQRPIAGFTAASFVCLIASFPLVAAQYLSSMAIGLFLVATVAGVAFTFSQDNG